MKQFVKHIPVVMLIWVILSIIGSFINYQDTLFTWIMEACPVFIFLPMLVLTFKRFRFPNWLYFAFALHMVVLLVGAHYSYAKVPLGFWMEDLFGFTRNNYDKIGHFMQGFTPALAGAELLFRTTTLNSKSWTFSLSVCISMTVSAIYEIIEWIVGANSPEDSEAFLGTQGYVWDTQTDMFMCLIGAIVAVVLYRSFRRMQ